MMVYRPGMATNLRLRTDAEQALRREAIRSGRTQQDIIRAAVDRYLGLATEVTPRTELGTLLADGSVRPPRTEFTVVPARVRLDGRLTSLDLLDRVDRV